MTFLRTSIALSLIILQLLITTSCSKPSPTSPSVSKNEKPLFEHYFLGKELATENLTIWAVLTDSPEDLPTYLSLAEAQDQRMVDIREILDVHGEAQVTRVSIENRASTPILIPGGTVLKGGKQDRQVAMDQVIAANSSQAIEAFCVEHGRWTEEREGISTDNVFTCANIIAAKRVRASAQYAHDQSQVWSQVSTLTRRANKSPDTETYLSAIEEDESDAVHHRKKLEDAVSVFFASLGKNREGKKREVVGFAYAINGEPITLRAFANNQIFRSQLPAFIRTMSMESELIQRRDKQAGRTIHTNPASSTDLIAMVNDLRSEGEDSEVQFERNRMKIRKNPRAGRAICLVPNSHQKDEKDPEEKWIAIAEDWTRAVEPEADNLAVLGYTR